MSNPGEPVWGYSQCDAPEWWDGACPSRDEAIAEGMAEYDGEPFYIVKGAWADPATYALDADDILEHMGERAYDDAGECAEEWPPAVDAAAKEELTAFVAQWTRKHCNARWWTATADAERVEPEEEDSE